MRKILMFVIAILLGVLVYVMATKGLSVFGLEISSVGQIAEYDKAIDAKIEQINTTVDTEYPKKMTELKKAYSDMEDAKTEYLRYTNASTDEEILAAMQDKSYKIEFLWTKLGTHARQQGVKLKFEITTSSTGANSVNDIKFTINGSYIAITNFIYAIENDSDLEFKVENFKLLPSQGDILEGTFTVKNIAVEGNTSSKAVTSSATSSSTSSSSRTSSSSSKNSTTTNSTEKKSATNTITEQTEEV